jgi:hypothetical protein
MDDPTAQAAHLDRIRELETALRFYSDAFPAFRGKPVGAPGSIERQAQETHIEWETKALAALDRGR